MRILFLVGHSPWPLNQGRSLRNFQILKYLAERHELDVLCGYGQDLPEVWPSEVEKLWDSFKAFPWPARSKWKRVIGLCRSWPDLWQAHFSPALIREGCDLLKSGRPYGRIHVAGFEMFGCASAIIKAAGASIPVVLDEQNIEFRLQQSLGKSRTGIRPSIPYRLFNSMQIRKLRREEEAAWRTAAHVLTVSEADRQETLRIIQRNRAMLLPNGVEAQDTTNGRSSQAPRPFQLSFIGKMDYRPNVLAMKWFCSEVFPQLKVLQPRARLNIVGRDPAPEVLKLRSLNGVTVTGYVEDLGPFYAPGTIAILPMFHGGGTRLKVFEAIMEGVPLVSTELGISGIGLCEGRHYLLAENAIEFVEAINSLWSGQVNIDQLVKEGREFVSVNFDWSAHLPVLDEVFP